MLDKSPTVEAPTNQIVAVGRLYTMPAGPRVYREHITHPVGASKEVAIETTFVDWPDGAQTCRAGGAPWLCYHGAGPFAELRCDHIAAIVAGEVAL